MKFFIACFLFSSLSLSANENQLSATDNAISFKNIVAKFYSSEVVNDFSPMNKKVLSGRCYNSDNTIEGAGLMIASGSIIWGSNDLLSYTIPMGMLLLNPTANYFDNVSYEDAYKSLPIGTSLNIIDNIDGGLLDDQSRANLMMQGQTDRYFFRVNYTDGIIYSFNANLVKFKEIPTKACFFKL